MMSGPKRCWKKKTRNKPTKKERDLPLEDVQQILFLLRKRIFYPTELAGIFGVSCYTIKKLAKQGFSPEEKFIQPEIERISLILDEWQSRGVRQILWKASQGREEPLTPMVVIEAALTLLGWCYGIKIGPRFFNFSPAHDPRLPLPRFALLRSLARAKGKPRTKRFGTQIFSKQKYKFLARVCLYHGIDLWFVRRHYDREGRYWSLGRLKALAKEPHLAQQKAWGSATGPGLAKKRMTIGQFFDAHGISWRKTQRFTNKFIKKENS